MLLLSGIYSSQKEIVNHQFAEPYAMPSSELIMHAYCVCELNLDGYDVFCDLYFALI